MLVVQREVCISESVKARVSPRNVGLYLEREMEIWLRKIMQTFVEVIGLK